MQYNWKYRIYGNGIKTSDNFDDLISNKVNVRIKPDMILSHTSQNTPFRGVRILPYRDLPELTELFAEIKRIPQHPEYIWKEIKQSIFEQWIPEKIHVIGGSSGYDSRMIAKAIQELRKQHGSDWFGETYFVECGGEHEGFLSIMKALKYENNCLIVWRPNYTFEYFANHSNRYNGLCAYPVNQWYDFYVKNWNEDDIQYISGYGGNVADAMRSYPRPTIQERLRLYFTNQYYYQISAFKQPKYSFHPFWSWRYIKAVCGIEHNEKRTAVFLSKLFVAECNRIKRMTILGDVKGLGYLTLREQVIRELYAWYLSTEYGKKNPAKSSSQIEYNKWWLQFCIASYAEANNIGIN